MNRTIASLVVLAAVGAAVAFVLLDPDRDGPTDDGLDPNAPVSEEPVAGLEGRSNDAAGGEGDQIELRITGIVRSGGDGVRATVEIFRGGGVSPINPTRPDIDDRRSSMRAMMAAQLGVNWDPALASVETGSDGTFAIAELPSGFYSVWARDSEGRQGYGRMIVPVRGAARHIELDLAETGSPLSVRVMRGDEPFTGSLYVILAERGDFGGPTARADLDDEGRAEFAALPGTQIRLIAFASDTNLAVSGPIDIPQADEYVWTIGGESSATTGKVVDLDDNGIAGATVVVMAGDPMSGMVMETGTTASDGTFSIDVAGQAQMMQASAPGYANSQGGPNPDGEILIRLTPLVGVSGQVLKQDGAPVRGARVLAMSLGRDRRGTSAVALADANGRFALTGVEPGEVMVFVLGGGWISDALWKVENEGFNPLAFDLPPEGRTDLTLEVVKAPGIEGHVFDGAGAPVAGAIVTPNLVGGGFGSWGWRGGTEGVAVTDDAGRFAFDALIPKKTYTLTADAAGRPKGRLENVVLAMDAPHAPVEIRLPAERWLQVAVTGVDGEPVALAKIRARRKHAGQHNWSDVEGRWTTNAAGVATVGPLPEGQLGLTVAASEYIDEDEPVAVPDAPPGPTPEPVTITLQKGVAITGRIEFPEGAELGEVRVTAESHGNGPGQRWIHVDGIARADGTFRIAGLTPGRYEVNARVFSRRGSVTGRVEADAPATDVVVRLSDEDGGPKPGGPRSDGAAHLEIQIVAPDGSAVSSGRMTVYSKNRTSGTSIQGTTRVQIGTGEDVWVEVRDLPGGLGATAGTGLYGPFPPDTGSITIKLEPATTTTGRVVDPSGQGVKGVRIVVVPDNPLRGDYDPFRGPTATARSADDGTFALKGLKAGTFLMDVSVPSTFIKPDVRSIEGGETSVRIELRQGAAPAITVVDYRGQPVAGASVSASEIREERHHGPADASARTNENGECVLEGVDPDKRYTLHANISPDDRSDLAGARVDDWTPEDTTLEFPRAYTATGVVHGQDGNPVAEVTVWWQTPGESGASGIGTDKDGRFRIGPQTAPEIDVWVRLDDSVGGHVEKMRIKADAEDVVLSIDAGVSIDVRVEGWSGGDHGRATLSSDGSRGFGDTQFVGADGRIRFPHLDRDKTYRLWIPAGADGKYVLRSGIRGDAGQVTVTAEPGATIRGHVIAPAGVDLENVYMHLQREDVGGVQAKTDEDGSFEVVGLPDGEWNLYAGYNSSDGNWSGQAKVAAGASNVEIVLKKQE